MNEVGKGSAHLIGDRAAEAAPAMIISSPLETEPLLMDLIVSHRDPTNRARLAVLH